MPEPERHMRPRLSFCIPAHPGNAPLLARSLWTLRLQSAPPDTFEADYEGEAIERTQ